VAHWHRKTGSAPMTRPPALPPARKDTASANTALRPNTLHERQTRRLVRAHPNLRILLGIVIFAFGLLVLSYELMVHQTTSLFK
jgi:hypothetical protein